MTPSTTGRHQDDSRAPRRRRRDWLLVWLGPVLLTVQIACGGGPTTPGSGNNGGTIDAGACRFSIADTVTTRTTDATAKDLVIGVTAGTGCGWTATTQSDFFSIVSGATGSGNGQVTVRVTANQRGQRQGSLIVAQITVTIVQDAAPCRFTLSGDLDRSFTAAGGTGTVTVGVSQGASCQWTATTDARFVTITPGGGTGDGSFSYTVAPSTDAARTGAITAGGQTVTIRQAAGPHIDSDRLLAFIGERFNITASNFTPGGFVNICSRSTAVPTLFCSPDTFNPVRVDGGFQWQVGAGLSGTIDVWGIDLASGLSSNHLTLTVP